VRWCGEAVVAPPQLWTVDRVRAVRGVEEEEEPEGSGEPKAVGGGDDQRSSRE
jgi:hypothetical protein